MITNLAIDSSKALNDLESEANAVIGDPYSNGMTLVTSMKDVQAIVAQAKKSEGALCGILAQIHRATRQ